MKKILALFAIASLFLGCETTPHYNRTKVVTLGAPLPKKPYENVRLFQGRDEVPADYDVVAIMSVEGKPGEEAAFIKAFLHRAADLGADAVILHRVSLTSGIEGGGWVMGKGGGFGLPLNSTQDAVYRGEAIRLR